MPQFRLQSGIFNFLKRYKNQAGCSLHLSSLELLRLFYSLEDSEFHCLCPEHSWAGGHHSTDTLHITSRFSKPLLQSSAKQHLKSKSLDAGMLKNYLSSLLGNNQVEKLKNQLKISALFNPEINILDWECLLVDCDCNVTIVF